MYIYYVVKLQQTNQICTILAINTKISWDFQCPTEPTYREVEREGAQTAFNHSHHELFDKNELRMQINR